MEKAGKIWGVTQKVFSNINFEFHRIEIIKGGVCSKHYHRYKFNGFYVEKGSLIVRTWKEDSKLVDSITLTNGDWHIVEPEQFHQFEALEDTIAFELYWTMPLSEDIIRENSGFLRKVEQ